MPVHRPRARARSTWSSSSSTSTLDQDGDEVGLASAATCATSRPRSAAGRPGWPSVGWNSLYWNNHDQPRIVSRWGDDGEHRVAAAKMLATVLHLHRGTPYVYQGEELGMTNAPFASIDDFRDIESLNHYAEAIARGDAPEEVLAAMRADEPRQRAHADAVGRLRARRLHHRHAVDRGQPQPHRDQRAGGARGPGLRLPPLPPADRAAPQRAGRRARRLHDAAAQTTSTSTRSPAGSTTSSCSCSATSRRRRPRRRSTAGTTPRS